MTSFADCLARSLRPALLAAVGLALIGISGCNGGSVSSNAETKFVKGTKATAEAQNSTGPGIDLNCVINHIQNPPESFHYSFQKQSSNPVQEEADITPQTIDGSFKNNSASHSFHGIRSDTASWQGAWSSLMGISGISSAVALVRNSSAIVPEGTEKVNGYDATKYSIDTARGTAEEKSLYQQVLGAGGFEKGTAWVTADGCPVKFVMDSEMHPRSGSVETIHYEEAMTRK